MLFNIKRVAEGVEQVGCGPAARVFEMTPNPPKAVEAEYLRHCRIK